MDTIVPNATLRGQHGTVDIIIEKDRIASAQPKVSGKGRREIDVCRTLVLPGPFKWTSSR
jgi:dihydroorotase-like cyclic amidohydrolase